MDEWVNALGAQEEQDRSPVGEHTYLCIDLKTFYASVECADRGLDPFTSRLVVADPSRGRSTICLAITPALKELGIRNRCRVFEIPEQILATTIMARPRMRHYMEVSAQIYGTYLEFVSPSDIHPYSIDECFIDATPYLKRYGLSAEAFARRLMDAVEERHHICATAGIGPAREHAYRGARRGALPARNLAAPAHHRYLGHRPGHCGAARQVPRLRPHGRGGTR